MVSVASRGTGDHAAPRRGTVQDAYVAALLHDIADVPTDAVRFGVVRRPTPWFYAAVEENRRALGPPAELLEEFRDRSGTLHSEGMDGARAHNAALEEVDYDERYLASLDRSTGADRAIKRGRGRLSGGTDVALVCYGNADEKRCHRTPLRERI